MLTPLVDNHNTKHVMQHNTRKHINFMLIQSLIQNRLGTPTDSNSTDNIRALEASAHSGGFSITTTNTYAFAFTRQRITAISFLASRTGCFSNSKLVKYCTRVNRSAKARLSGVSGISSS